MSREILILGGGYVGVWSARRIVRSLRADEDVRVTLVSRSDVHSFHGWTAEVLTGHVALQRARTPLAGLLPGVEIVRGTVVGVDLDARTADVRTPDGVRALRYDRLVVGVGSHDASACVPGLGEHGWSLKDDFAVPELDAHLSRIVAAAASTADPAVRERLLTVVVAGAGFTGVEASAAIAQRLRTEIAAAPALADAVPRVVLAGSGPELLPSLRPRYRRLADYATAQVARAGVDVRPATRLAAVTADGALFEGGEPIASATVISTIGQTPVALAGTERFVHESTGRLVTDRYLQLAHGVWAGGDIAAVPHPFGGTCPANALWAIYHGKRIGDNVVRSLRTQRLVPFRFPGLGQGASLGVGRGVAELYGVSLTGWPAWIARWAFFHWFMPSREVAWHTAREWFRRPARRRASTAVPADRLVGALAP